MVAFHAGAFFGNLTEDKKYPSLTHPQLWDTSCHLAANDGTERQYIS